MTSNRNERGQLVEYAIGRAIGELRERKIPVDGVAYETLASCPDFAVVRVGRVMVEVYDTWCAEGKGMTFPESCVDRYAALACVIKYG